MSAAGRVTGRHGAAAVMAAALVLLPARAVVAHEPGLSALDVQLRPDRVLVRLALSGVDAVLAAGHEPAALERFALEAIDLRVDGTRVRAQVEGVERSAEAGAAVGLAFAVPAGSRAVLRSSVADRLSFGHRQLLTVRDGAGRIVTERMLAAGSGPAALDPSADVRSDRRARDVFVLGVTHIMAGYDHLLFLAALLLTLQRLADVIKTITAFTVAHSLTLAAAALHLVQVPPALVEPLIAGSIVFVGAENLLRTETGPRWVLTFLFGLVHGLGFAGALHQLAPGGQGSVALTLALFNLGVETGQAGLASLVWPGLRRLNAVPAVRERLVPAGSAIVVGVGVYWLVVRIL